MLLAVFPGIHAQNETVKGTSGGKMLLHFRFDKAFVDSEYMDNRRTLSHLDEIFTNQNLIVKIDSLNIFSFASPEGNRAYNERLARQRSTAVKSYLEKKYPYFGKYHIHLHPQGENWKELRHLIESDPNMPNRDEALQVIDTNTDSERCKALLMKLNGGVPYHYIHTHLLHCLRSAALCMVWIRQGSLPALPSATYISPDSMKTKTVTKAFPSDDRENDNLTPYPQELSAASPHHRPLFALKTNLLFDAALMPNVEIEVPIGNRWSVNGEYMFPWWLMDGDKYSLQILAGGLEGRYWLGSRKNRMNREVLTGHFLGLYAGGGKYDLQWDTNGYQGEFFIAAGISYGYAHKIARNLHLEFNIGIGLLRTDYRHYHARDNYKTLLWQENGKYTWFGPTKAKISLVWLLNRKAKKGGDR